MRFEFGEFQLDDERYSLTGRSGAIHIEPQVFAVLHYLLVNRERVVPKEELLDAVWGSKFVSESALTSRIKAARRAVDDDGQAQRVVKTIYGRGYQFVADVRTEATRRWPTNLLRPLSTFVGRTEEVDALAGQLGEHRLVTLTGPGGVGKTRLSLEIAHRVATAYPGGALFVDLAAVTDEAGVQHALAGALAVDDQPGQLLIDTLTTVLDHRPSTLLVLDNCEHVVDACARLAHTVLSRCSGVSLLATSRVPLGMWKASVCVRSSHSTSTTRSRSSSTVPVS